MCFAYLASVCDTTVLKLPKRERQSLQTTMLDISGSFSQPQNSDFLQGNPPSLRKQSKSRARCINTVISSRSVISGSAWSWNPAATCQEELHPPQKLPASLPVEPESCLKAHTCDLFKGSRYLNGKLREMFFIRVMLLEEHEKMLVLNIF